MTTRQQKHPEDRQSKGSSSLFNCGEFIPVELIFEILSILHVKSIARCRCVSKLLSSTILRPDFTDFYLTKSATTQPRLLFAHINYHDKVLFYSSPQPNDESSHVVASYHMSFPLNVGDSVLNSAHGLICVKQTRSSSRRKKTVSMICNPSTGQYLTVPKVKPMRKNLKSFFGYDPVCKQFKLLAMSVRNSVSAEHQVLTLGNGKLLWRRTECNIPHSPYTSGICINGVFYYLAHVGGFEGKIRIVCFDARSEKFSLIGENDEILAWQLVNYKGKLATVRDDWGCVLSVGSKRLKLCVLEDAEKNEWSTHTYVLPPSLTDLLSPLEMVINGVTRTGEMVLSLELYDLSGPCYLLYYNLERNTIRKVEIHGIGEYRKLYTFIDHVEDVKLGGVFESS